MRLIVMSDSHGDRARVEGVLRRHEKDGDIFIHLGDGVEEFRALSQHRPEKAFLCVVGNCDDPFERELSPETHVFSAGKYKVLLTHGHKYSVKYDLLHLGYAAAGEGASLALYGHTHVPAQDEWNGIRLVNPGSLRFRRTYAIIDVEESGIRVEHREI